MNAGMRPSHRLSRRRAAAGDVAGGAAGVADRRVRVDRADRTAAGTRAQSRRDCRAGGAGRAGDGAGPGRRTGPSPALDARWPGVPLAYAGIPVDVTMVDEQGKIDINAADPTLLSALFRALGVPQDKATRVASAMVDWRDADSLTQPQGGAEDPGLCVGGPAIWRQGRAVRNRRRNGAGAGHDARDLRDSPRLTSRCSPATARPIAFAAAPVLTAMGLDGPALVAAREARRPAPTPGSWPETAERIVSESVARLREGRTASDHGSRAHRRQRLAGLGLHGAGLARRDDGAMILRDSLGRYGARIGLGAGGLFAWWRAALAAWLPTRWQALFGWARDRLLLAPDGDGFELRLDRGGEVRRPRPPAVARQPVPPRIRWRPCSARRSSTCRAGWCCRPAADCAGACSCRLPRSTACATCCGSRSSGRRRSTRPASCSTRCCSGAGPMARPTSN